MHRSQHSEDQILPDHSQIIGALNAVLESDKFTAAPQMSAFLRYVVEQAASGNMTRIKAYTVAIDALGKPDSFDPQNDPVVRVLAGRLRAALASYYEANPNVDLRITMRPGSYVPSFIFRSTIEASERTNTSLPQNRVSSANPTPNNTVAPTTKKELRHDTALKDHSPHAEMHSAKTINEAVAEKGPTKNDANFATHFRWLFRLPTVGIALAALGIFVGSQLTQLRTTPGVSNTNVSASLATTHASYIQRNRPEQVSLFVSALEQGNSLNDQLNTMLSGVFSESNSVYVYRVFDSLKSTQHWPEDYLVTVDILPLPNETRVSVQLVEAQTGKISHSENISLSKTAAEGLNGEELVTITQFARKLISDNGPLFNDYRTKLASSN